MRSFKTLASRWFLWWLALHPVLDVWVWGPGRYSKFFAYGNISVQSFIGVLTLLIGWCTLFVERREISRRAWLVAAAITALTTYAVLQAPGFMGLSYWLRIQIWVVLALVFQNLLVDDEFRKKIINAGLFGAVFFTAVLLIDTFFSGGIMCGDHRVWEVGGGVFRNHEYTVIVSLLPFVILSIDNFRNRFVKAALIILTWLIALLVGWTFVRAAWLGMLAMAFTLVVVGRKHRPHWSVGLGQIFFFIIFLLLTLPGQRERFRAELGAKQALVQTLQSAKTENVHPSDQPAAVPQSIAAIKNNKEKLGVFFSRIGSGRMGVWMHHLEVWGNYTIVQKWFGRGPMAGDRFGGIEVNNDGLRLLLDMGIAGLSLFFGLCFWFLWSVRRLERPAHLRNAKVLALAVFFGLLAQGFASGVLFGGVQAWYTAPLIGCLLAMLNKDQADSAGRERS